MTDVGRHGDGSITRRKDGRLQVSITLTSHRRIYRTVPRLSDPKRQRELAERLRRELIAMREAELDPGGQTLRDYLRSWLDSMASARNARIRPNTLAGYRIIAERHLLPVLGSYRLEALRERHVQAWLDGLDMSAQYVANCRAFLRRVLNVAVDQRVIARNPATRGVELPKVPRYRAQPLSPDEARALIAATRDDWLGAFWRLAVVTGLRLGELQGLAWSDVELGGNDGRFAGALGRGDTGTVDGLDAWHGEPAGRGDAGGVVGDGGTATGLPGRRVLGSVMGRDDAGRAAHRAGGQRPDVAGEREVHRGGGQLRPGPSLTVRHALQRQNGQWVRAATKAARDLEVIAIDAVTAGVLEAHRKRQAAARQPDWPYWGLVFVTPTGRPYHRKEMGDLFRDACDRAGIARRRIHDLRGSSAAIMADLGIAESVRMARLGHATKAMARRYAGASAAQDQDAVELLAKEIG